MMIANRLPSKLGCMINTTNGMNPQAVGERRQNGIFCIAMSNPVSETLNRQDKLGIDRWRIDV